MDSEKKSPSVAMLSKAYLKCHKCAIIDVRLRFKTCFLASELLY